MKTVSLFLFTTGVGLTAGNYIAQLILDHNWTLALDRSIFQAFALICAGFAVHRSGKLICGDAETSGQRDA